MENGDHFIWQQEYSVGIIILDRQHKEIIALIRDLSQLCTIDDRVSYDTFKLMVSSTMEYLRHHFWEEEKHMREKNYPGFAKHKAIHETMLTELKEMIDTLGKKETVNIKSVTAYLKESYMEHLQICDKEMGEYFTASSI
ncbi:MAG: hemerythrin domain-containing protein [Treponema sp.]|nr:hemerythrin domain-containing protein [Treponema sp.]